jgi:hypothetical protein
MKFYNLNVPVPGVRLHVVQHVQGGVSRPRAQLLLLLGVVLQDLGTRLFQLQLHHLLRKVRIGRGLSRIRTHLLRPRVARQVLQEEGIALQGVVVIPYLFIPLPILIAI